MSRTKRIVSWAVPAIVVAALAVAAFAFHEEIVSWFQPGTDTVAVSTTDGMTMGDTSDPAEAATQPATQSATQPATEPAIQPATQPVGDEAHAGHSHATAEGGAAYYTCPMHPSVRMADPDDKCPICGMDLVPVFEEPEGEEASAVIGPMEMEEEVSMAEADLLPEESADDVAYYTCSMHPSVRSDDPEATCPICAMDLVPVTHEEIETGMVMVDDLRRQRFGVKIEPVRRMELEKNIRAVGRLKLDERRVADVSTRFGGYVGEVFAEAEGDRVEAGKPLFTIYSPEVLSAQEELLETIKRQGAGGSLAEAAARRLRLWGLDDGFVAAIRDAGEAKEYVPIEAPISGVVIEKEVYPGTAVQEGRMLYRLANLSTLWLEAEVFESELPLIEAGQKVLVTTPYLPGRSFEATVDYIYPQLDARTRTARLRIVVPNEDGTLMPEMFVNADLRALLGNQLVVPETAVLYAGEKRIVFIDEGEGRLEPREVKIGQRTDDYIAILSGLDETDPVVTSGNFLIAAESKMKSAVEKW